MRTSKFSKYHGAGNAFVLTLDFDKTFSPSLVPDICQKEGVDGLILARPSLMADFEMVYFNRDGSRAAMCGNDLRCFVHFLRDEGFVLSSYQIEIASKILTVKCEESKILIFIPLPRVLFWEIELLKRTVYVVDVGVPHLVTFAKGPVDVVQVGGALRHHKSLQPDGANVNFVQVDRDGGLIVRTYERGVEAETLACGTGVVASAFVAHRLGLCSDKAMVTTRSGAKMELVIGDEVTLIGPSERMIDACVFEKRSSRREEAS